MLAALCTKNMKAHLNNKEYKLRTEEELSEYLEEVDSTDNVEAWITSQSGSSICLLKAQDRTFLMYLRYLGDVGFVSHSDSDVQESIEFLMANGQADEYPLSWCIEKEWAYKALAYFFVNTGEQSPHINWQVA